MKTARPRHPSETGPRQPRHQQPAPTSKAHHHARHTPASVITITRRCRHAPLTGLFQRLPASSTRHSCSVRQTRQSRALCSVTHPMASPVLTDYGERRLLACHHETRKHRLPRPAATHAVRLLQQHDYKRYSTCLPVAVLPLKHRAPPSARQLQDLEPPHPTYSSRPSGTALSIDLPPSSSLSYTYYCTISANHKPPGLCWLTAFVSFQ